MLAATKKPYNPNYDQSTTDDKNWNKTDLLSFLDNIHNVPINDITISGKDITFFQTATKAQTAAELISTINLTQYKLLSAVKDITNYNNLLINKTQKRNNSIDFWVKQIKELATQTQRNNFLLLKMAHNKPRTSNIDEPIHSTTIDATGQTFAQTTQTNCASANLFTNTRNQNSILNEPQSNHNTINTITTSPTTDMFVDFHINTLDANIDATEQINEQTTQIKCALPKYTTPNLCENMRNQNILLIEPSHNKINIITSPLTTDIIDDGNINEPKDTIIEQPINTFIIGSSEQTIDLETTQTFYASANPSANMCGHNNLLNEPQLKHNTIKSIIASPTTDIIDDAHINTFDKILSKNPLEKSSVITRDINKIVNSQLKSKNKNIKPKIKIKKKKKKIKNKNNNKRNKKKIKHQKTKKMNIIVKNKFKNDEIENYLIDMEQMVRNEFTDDDYQDWMNFRLFDPEYTAAIHYEKTYGTSAINKIKKSHTKQ